MEELPRALLRISSAARQLDEADAARLEARAELIAALREARRLGATLRQCGESAGVSRQRVAALLSE